MRTTLTLEDSLAEKLHALARKRKSSFKKILNEVVRDGLAKTDQPQKSKPFRVTPIMRGGFLPGIDVDKINQFLDDEEIDSFASKMKQGK